MEFSFDVGKVLPGVITVLESNFNESDIKIYSLDKKNDGEPDTWIYHASANTPWDLKLKRKKEDFVTIIDEMGCASAHAQSLRSPITTLKKFLNSKNQKIYFIRDINNNKAVIGFLKIGIKRLFICDDVGAHHEMDPLCVLDFYVHESKQRCGFGHELFNIMLQAENVSPEKLAVDRPSLKFLSFLNKHYSLKDHIVQTNNFVMFPGFFTNREVTRPPIFLYNGNAMQSVKCNNPRKQHSQLSSYTNEAEALSSIKVSLCSNELKKNKTYYSSAENCLTWDDRRTKPNSNHCPNPSVRSNNPNTNRSSSSWHGCSPTQSCSEAYKKVDGWNTNRSSPCSLTPVNSIPNYSRKKWDQTHSSSWNILGVKPIDYSLYQKQS